MRFTILGLAAGIIYVIAGANPLFIPAHLAVGFAIDRAKKTA